MDIPDNEEEKERTYWDTSALVYFTSYEDQIARGKLEVLYSEKIVDFQGVDQLLLILEDMMDTVNENCKKEKYPGRNCQRRRVFLKKEPCTEVFFEDAKSVREIPKKPCFNPQKPYFKEKCIFFAVIIVNFRLHASMQGVLKIDGDEICFRSALELQRMLHQVLAATVGETKNDV